MVVFTRFFPDRGCFVVNEDVSRNGILELGEIAAVEVCVLVASGHGPEDT